MALYQLTMENGQGLVEVGQPDSLPKLAERVRRLVADFQSWEQRGCPKAELGEPYTQIEGADLIAEEVGGDRAFIWNGSDWEVF